MSSVKPSRRSVDPSIVLPSSVHFGSSDLGLGGTGLSGGRRLPERVAPSLVFEAYRSIYAAPHPQGTEEVRDFLISVLAKRFRMEDQAGGVDNNAVIAVLSKINDSKDYQDVIGKNLPKGEDPRGKLFNGFTIELARSLGELDSTEAYYDKLGKIDKEGLESKVVAFRETHGLTKVLPTKKEQETSPVTVTNDDNERIIKVYAFLGSENRLRRIFRKKTFLSRVTDLLMDGNINRAEVYQLKKIKTQTDLSTLMDLVEKRNQQEGKYDNKQMLQVNADCMNLLANPRVIQRNIEAASWVDSSKAANLFSGLDPHLQSQVMDEWISQAVTPNREDLSDRFLNAVTLLKRETLKHILDDRSINYRKRNLLSTSLAKR
ncbi:MAG: hypothetical protein ABH950_09545 [Candidatus Altiarchaeota archaeon]